MGSNPSKVPDASLSATTDGSGDPHTALSQDGSSRRAERQESEAINTLTSGKYESASLLGKNFGDLQAFPAFGNSWPPEFSTFRYFRDALRFVNIKKNVDAEGDDLEIFFLDYWDLGARLTAEVVTKFCCGISPADVVQGKGRAGHWRSVWLDERSCIPDLEGEGEVRPRQNPLSATGLYRALMKERFKDDCLSDEQRNLPDAARRLIYVSDLDPGCIHALTSTASCNQAPHLRDAIAKHLDFHCEISVSLSTSGFLTFELALHLPIFLLRDTQPEPLGDINFKPRRKWTDLSFLDVDIPGIRSQEPKRSWGIHEAHISFVVTGTDDWRWVAYGFVDAEIDGTLHEASEEDLLFDQISCGELDAGLPIWRPREYWLRVSEIRIKQVAMEWGNLIRTVESSVQQYMSIHPITISGRSGIAQKNDAELRAAFDWTIRTMDLINRIDSVHSNMLEAWEFFSHPDGDKSFFCDTERSVMAPAAHRSLHKIRTIFGDFHRTQKKIVLLNKRCSEYKWNLQLRLSVENKEATDGNEKISHFTVSILYPLGLAAAICSMQQKAIPFDLSPRSFVMTAVLLTITIYAARLVLPYTISGLPIMRREVSSWLKRRNVVIKFSKLVDDRRQLADDEENALGTRK